ncbi:MAG: hypothetical protein COX82_02875 [Candidatus Magasanikbacteria bacterium CG_4_10_14_0_2_um_filter_41_10]|uniref:Uncharacterized protein n=1 Tax=Candidatus Magasanikbacteria bacterium CG_4_10_14_0_2_um_filter_41_10 TaxID=1974638 RepID=A0A2M7V435_9BACT|nr:MAG: hypothetical protein COX82_02875 [Candidatus Magasanikbacteria bacterium CG_4_10_14_0_2_um_filter_41_10]
MNVDFLIDEGNAVVVSRRSPQLRVAQAKSENVSMPCRAQVEFPRRVPKRAVPTMGDCSSVHIIIDIEKYVKEGAKETKITLDNPPQNQYHR